MSDFSNYIDGEETKVHTGKESLFEVLKYYGSYIVKDELDHCFDKKEVIEAKLKRFFHDRNFKVKTKQFKDLEKAKSISLPIIAKLKNGEYVIITEIGEKSFVIYDTIDKIYTKMPTEVLKNHWDGDSILIKPKNVENKFQEKFSLKWFIQPLRKYKKAIIEVLVSTFFLQLLGLISPLMMQVIIDKVLTHNSETTLKVLSIALLIIMIFEFIIGLAKSYIFVNTTSKVDMILGIKVFKQLITLPLSYFEKRRIGDTLTKIREVENVREFVTGAPLTAMLDVCFIFIYLIVMIFYSKLLTFIILTSVVFFAIMSIATVPLFRYLLNIFYEKGADENSYLVESVTGIQTIKSLSLEHKKERGWEKILSEYIKSRFKIRIFSDSIGQLGDLIRKFFDLFVLFVGVNQVMTGKLSFGALIAFRMLANNVSNPILKLVGMWQHINQIKISMIKIGDIFDTETEDSNKKVMNIKNIDGDIELKNIYFRYESNKPFAIKNFNLQIKKGEVIGIVGRSGSGKSTISKLIQNLYIPERGSIYINDNDISNIPTSILRKHIGVVLQENFLFRGTIRENISIAKPTASMEEIIECAKLAGAHEFVMELRDKYETYLGENGVGLSGGQRQRIAIARALITNPSILIFDEATSALDYESESIIQKNLLNICSGKTVLIIAHRLSTLKDAHKIAVIEKGNLVEFDTHENLMETKGYYYNLYMHQERKE